MKIHCTCPKNGWPETHSTSLSPGVKPEHDSDELTSV